MTSFILLFQRFELNEILLQLRSFGRMLLINVAVVILALSISYCFNNYYPLTSPWINSFEYIGYVCWGAALAESKVESWSRSTPAERLHRSLQVLLSEVGVLVFVIARTLVT